MRVAPALLVLLSVWYPGAAPAQTDSPRRYANTTFAWSVEVPAGWTVDAPDPAFVELRPVRPRPDALVGIQSASGPAESLETLATLVVDGWRRAQAAAGRTVTLRARERWTLRGGVEAIEVVADLEPETPERTRIFVLRLGETIVVINAQCKRRDWNVLDPIFTRIVASFSSGAGR